jgi:lipoprotein-releasing system permease protein
VCCHFEWFVARRYLTAKRKQAVISVITLISVGGVAAGVMALVIAMAVTNGFRNAVEQKLLGATAHVMVLEKEPSAGIENWRTVVDRLSRLPYVRHATPSLYDTVMFNGDRQASGGVLKGVLPPDQAPVPEPLRELKEGKFTGWGLERGRQQIILGYRLAEQLGAQVGSEIKVLTRHGDMTPLGIRVTEYPFLVIGTFDSGYFEIDNAWAFTSLDAVQRILGLEARDVVNAVELTLTDLHRAPDVARAAEQLVKPQLAATHWMEQHRQLLTALDGEKKMVIFVIGLILLVATLNILISLIMMVMEKHRDIALLMSMGARRPQITRLFILQGGAIGAVGALAGLVAGHLFCLLANRFRLLGLDESVYSLSHVPFEPRFTDSLWIFALALVVSLVATIYPARSATRISPAEALRYW